MSTSETEAPSFATQEEIDSFGKHLYKSKQILALCGAGLSAASGIPTFRGSGAMSTWRGHTASSLSSVETFNVNPGLVWQYMADRRHLALQSKPNKAHEALAKLAKKKPGFVCLTQNIDGLSQKANHPRDRLYELHGSLMTIKCVNNSCDYVEKENLKPVICPALACEFEVLPITTTTKPTSSAEAAASEISSMMLKDEIQPIQPQYERQPNPLQEILDSLAPIITDEMREEVVPTSELPHCPKCSSLLRPGVVWFGESLSRAMFDEIEAWIDAEKKLDMMLVIGTTAQVYPAARFVEQARQKGARIAVINMEAGHLGENVLRKQDWLFEGNAAEILPVLFEGTLEN